MRPKVQPIQVYVSSVIDAPISRVWSMVRDFDSLPKWHPAVASCQIEGGRKSSEIGCIRLLKLLDGSSVREQLLELSDTKFNIVYNIIQSDIGLLDYVAEMTFLSITDGDKTLAIWTANFRTVPGQEESKRAMVENDVFQRGFDALKAKLA